MSKDVTNACNTESGCKGLLGFVIRKPGISTVLIIITKNKSCPNNLASINKMKRGKSI